MKEQIIQLDRERPATAMKLSLVRSVSAAAIGVVTASVLGRGLGVGGYGRYQLVANLAAQVGQLCEAGVGTAVIALRQNGDTDFKVLRVVGKFFAAMALPTLLLSAGLVYLLVKDAHWFFFLIGCVISISTFAQALVIGVLRAFGRSRLANAVMVMPPLLNLPFIAALWWTGMLSPLVALAVLAVAYAVMVLIAAVWLLYLVRLFSAHGKEVTSSPVSFGELFRMSWKSSATRISQLLIYRFDLFLLTYFVGEEPLGIYVPAVFLASQLNHLGDSVGFILYPSLARREMNSAHVGDACRGVMLVTCIASIVIAFASPWALWLVWGSAYESSVVPLLLLLPGYVFLTPAKALSAYLAVETQFDATLKASLAGLAINSLLNLLLIPDFGVVGAAIATSIALICVSAVLSYQFRLRSGIRVRDFWIPRRSDVHRGLSLIRSKAKSTPVIQNC